MSDQVGNTEDLFSHNEAHLSHIPLLSQKSDCKLDIVDDDEALLLLLIDVKDKSLLMLLELLPLLVWCPVFLGLTYRWLPYLVLLELGFDVDRTLLNKILS